MRGNLNTRLAKLDNGEEYDALILARAGIERMGWQDRLDETLGGDVCLYAVGQVCVWLRVCEGERGERKCAVCVLMCVNGPCACACVYARGDALILARAGIERMGCQDKLERPWVGTCASMLWARCVCVCGCGWEVCVIARVRVRVWMCGKCGCVLCVDVGVDVRERGACVCACASMPSFWILARGIEGMGCQDGRMRH